VKTLEIQTSDLLPFQVSVDRKTVFRKMKEEDFEVLAIPYNGKFIIRDGTHASCAAEMKKKPVKAHVYESNEEFRRIEDERGFDFHFESMQQALDYYRTEFAVQAERERIFSVRDLNDLYMSYLR
jgi:glutathione synthase/RimK-type ligase-like ATP-grasp enzyme